MIRRPPRSTLFPSPTLSRSPTNDDPPIGSLTITQSGPRTAVPEPASWAMMLLGFGAIGLTIRRRKREAQQHHRPARRLRSEEHTSELQSPCNLVCRLLLAKK